MDIVQTIRVRATIPDDATINLGADGQAVSWTDTEGNTFKFWAIVEKESADGTCGDIAGDDVDKHGIFYDYDERYFEVVSADEPASASAGAQATHGDNDGCARAAE